MFTIRKLKVTYFVIFLNKESPSSIWWTPALWTKLNLWTRVRRGFVDSICGLDLWTRFVDFHPICGRMFGN